MLINAYNPLRAMLRNETSRAFPAGVAARRESNPASSAWIPAVDIKESDKDFLITADIPGVDPAKIEITTESGFLSIKGERTFEARSENKSEGEGESRNEGYRRIERAHGSFYRRFALPDTADADAITARGTNGVLEVVIPKRASLQPKRIAVAA